MNSDERRPIKLRIAQLRGTRGITQKELAQAMSISYQSVSKWECGAAYPDITMLPKLARYFGVSVDYILGLDSRESKRRRVFLAADQGGTKTKVLLCDFNGEILASRVVGGACWFYSGLDKSIQLLAEASNALMTQAEIGLEEVAFIVCGAAGINWEDERAMFTRALERKLNVTAFVLNDSAAAVYCDAFDVPNRIALCAGTEFDAAVLTPSMSTPFVYCNHTLPGDMGGSRVGDCAINAVLRADERLAPRTSLTQPVLRHLGLSTVADLLVAYRRGKMPRAPKELTPLVFAEAVGGDEVSLDIVLAFADAMCAYVRGAVQKYKLQNEHLAVLLAGGVFRNDCPRFYARIAEHVHAACRRGEILRTKNEIVLGAYQIGLEKAKEYMG